MTELTVSEINIYPIKSLDGISLDSSELSSKGLTFDRRWMLVDRSGKFITQRQYPQLALISTSLADKGIVVTNPDGDSIVVPYGITADEAATVTVWRDQVSAAVASPEVNQWFSEYLQAICTLVYMPDDFSRAVDSEFSVSTGDEVSFADGFPFLMISEASLRDLNDRLRQQGHLAVPMKRFRPNIVVSNLQAFEEDSWKKISIAGMVFYVVKPCSRCIIPTIDTKTGIKGQEPIKTLIGYRKKGAKVYFGQNLIHEFAAHARISVGDHVEILE